MDDHALASIVDMVPFAKATGVRVVAADTDRVVAQLDWTPERCTAGGILHGGAITTLADTTGAVCAFLHLPEGATTATVELSVHLLRAVRSGTVTATATPLHTGSRFIVVRTDVVDDTGRLVASATQTQAVIV